MEAHSILFDAMDPSTEMYDRFAADVLTDIHIDAVIRKMVKGREEYDLEPFFTHKLPNAKAIQYRIEIMKDIDQADLLASLHMFSREMRKVREYDRQRKGSSDKEQRWKWHLDTAFYYCDAVTKLSRALQAATLHSLGLNRFAASLLEYVESAAFQQLTKEAFELRAAFDEITYSIVVENGKMTVSPTDIGKDYCQQLRQIFHHPSDSNEDDFSFRLFSGTQLSGLEMNILNIVKKLYPDPFRACKTFHAKFSNFINPSLVTFDREVQFYIASLEFFHSVSRQGLSYCYPVITTEKKIRIEAGYDVALASSDLHAEQSIVGNDLHLEQEERICVVTGPNQGGKTTFARFFGQVLFLSAIGCPVPCRAAEIYVFD